MSRRNPTSAQIIQHGNVNSIRNSNYNPNAPIKIVSHGWSGNGNSGSNTNVRDAFLANSDCNVIVVDWRALAGANYVSAVLGVPSVGEYVGNFLQWLISNGGGNWNNVHLVGYSLGAHVVGNAGRQSGRRVSRITGEFLAGFDVLLLYLTSGRIPSRTEWIFLSLFSLSHGTELPSRMETFK